MRTITKGVEPVSLTAHRKMLYSCYDNYEEKDDLRTSLVREQRGLCCYCMGRITVDRRSIKIEHWRCQSRYPSEQLDYSNLLGSCTGGEGHSPRFQHCDTYKGDKDLRWNPGDPSHDIETRLLYTADGSIKSDDDEFNAQLKAVLNLNLALLMTRRKRVLDAILEWWEHEKKQGRLSRRTFTNKRNQWAARSGKLQPYCGVVVWWLDRHLENMSV